MKLSNFFFVIALLCTMATPSYAEQKNESHTSFIRRYVKEIVDRFTPEEVAVDENRRRVVFGGAGAIGSLAVAGATGANVVNYVFSGLRQGLPNKVKTRLARLRLNPNGQMGLDRDSFIRYKDALERELRRTTDPNMRLAIQERLNQMRWALENRDNLSTLNDIQDHRPSLAELSNDPNRLERIANRLEQAKERLIIKGRLQSLIVQVLTARQMIDSMLLKRMAYQIHFVRPENNEYALVLNEDEVRTLKYYQGLINYLEKTQTRNFPPHHFLSQWLPVLKTEVDLALEMYEASQAYYSSKICRGLIGG